MALHLPGRPPGVILPRGLCLPLRYDSFLGGGGGAAGGGGGGDPYFANVVGLWGWNGTDGDTTASDESPAAHGAATFNGSAQLDSDAPAPIMDATSLRLSIGAYCNYSHHADWRLGSGDFTIETLVEFGSVAGNQVFLSHYASPSNLEWTFIFNGGTPQLNFAFATDGSSNVAHGSSWSPTTGVQYLVVAERDGNDLNLYAAPEGGSGTKLGTHDITGATLFAATADLEIGSRDGGLVSMTGWLDETRITKAARYQGTPPDFPTAAWPRM